jgi:L-fucose isomerase-like protein
MTQITLGFVPIARTTFDIPLAEAVIAQARASLANLNVPLVGPVGAVTTLEEAEAAAERLAADPPDVLVVFQATFADSTMLTALAERVTVPLLLWAVPEALTGGRLRLNSLCGINLGLHALRRLGRRADFVYAAPDDAEALRQVDSLLRAAYTRRQLVGARFGQVGDAPAGFPTCAYDSESLRRRFGVEVVPVALRERVFADVRALDPAVVEPIYAGLQARVAGLETVDEAATRGTLGVYAVLEALAGADDLRGLAVRCWPEFFTELGCAACGAVSMLNDARTPASCEADVHGTLTQYILQTISRQSAFGSDVVAVDDDNDALVLWHCGQAPLDMADPATAPGVTLHSNRRLPLLMQFTLKPGVVTIARLSAATGDYRLVIGRGEIVAGPPAFSGTSGRLRFDRPARDVLSTLLSEGLEHHVALTYGDHADALVALAAMLDLPVLTLC